MRYVGKWWVLLFLCILLPQTAYSVTSYLPGYIVDIHGDTLHGQLKYSDWEFNPLKIQFRTSKSSNPLTLTPNDIVAFFVSNRLFISAIVDKEVSPYRDSELQKDPDLHFEKDTVFLQVLVKGEKSLFYLSASNEKEQFYILEDTSIRLLIHKTYIEYNPTRKEYQNMRFIGQLTRYLWNEQSLLEEISSTTYSKTSLEHLFNSYLKQTDIKPVYQNSDIIALMKFGLLGGLSYTILLFETEYANAGLGPSTDFTGGISFDIPMMGRHHNLSFYNELMYSSYKTRNYLGSTFWEPWAEFDFQYIRFNTMIRYRPSWFFLNTGISNGFPIHSYSSMFPDVRKYEIGFVLGGGILYKNYSLEIRNEIGDGMSPYISTYVTSHRIQVLLGYSF